MHYCWCEFWAAKGFLNHRQCTYHHHPPSYPLDFPVKGNILPCSNLFHIFQKLWPTNWNTIARHLIVSVLLFRRGFETKSGQIKCNQLLPFFAAHPWLAATLSLPLYCIPAETYWSSVRDCVETYLTHWTVVLHFKTLANIESQTNSLLIIITIIVLTIIIIVVIVIIIIIVITIIIVIIIIITTMSNDFDNRHIMIINVSAIGGGAGVQGPGAVGVEEGGQCARAQDPTVAGARQLHRRHFVPIFIFYQYLCILELSQFGI